MPGHQFILKDSNDRINIVDYLTSGIVNCQDYPTKSTKQGFKRRCKPIRLQNDVLFYNDKLVVAHYDDEAVAAVFLQQHTNRSHPHRDATFANISVSHVGIPVSKIASLISECEACQSHNTVKTRDDMTNVVSYITWGHVQMDLIDLKKFCDENDGFNWIMTLTDVRTKYAVARPLRSKTMEDIVCQLADIISIHGPMPILQSDRGPEFKNKLLDSFCLTFNIDLRHGRVRHPQSQGQVERFNQTLVRKISKNNFDTTTGVTDTRYIDKLSDVVFDYNITKQRAVGNRPFTLYYGREPYGIFNADNLPFTSIMEDENPEPPQLLLSRISDTRADLMKTADARHDKYNAQMLRGNAHHIRKFAIGEIVRLQLDFDSRSKHRKKKFQGLFGQDLYKIITVHPDGKQGFYEIQDNKGNKSFHYRSSMKLTRMTKKVLSSCSSSSEKSLDELSSELSEFSEDDDEYSEDNDDDDDDDDKPLQIPLWFSNECSDRCSEDDDS
eukprot:Lithocolla_globosa_v1_NODE_702_length_3415_cov_5.136607.p1 type:complete len:497 gc:universal NODE_702_length_3415_cov_5.136607:1886-3376(+)